VGVRVKVDPELCIGTADCVRLAPQAFKLDDARGVSVPQSGAAATDVDVLEDAAFNCPTHAITVEKER
jgi:ferredoxin